MYESISSPEQSLPTPVLSIRAHHLRNTIIRDAFRGEVGKPQLIAPRHQKKSLTPAYFHDLRGYSSHSSRHFNEKVKLFLEKLASLPTNAWVQIDGQKDAICEACTIGTHCGAQNYITDENEKGMIAIDEDHWLILHWIEYLEFHNIPFFTFTQQIARWDFEDNPLDFIPKKKIFTKSCAIIISVQNLRNHLLGSADECT